VKFYQHSQNGPKIHCYNELIKIKIFNIIHLNNKFFFTFFISMHPFIKLTL